MYRDNNNIRARPSETEKAERNSEPAFYPLAKAFEQSRDGLNCRVSAREIVHGLRDYYFEFMMVDREKGCVTSMGFHKDTKEEYQEVFDRIIEESSIEDPKKN